MKEKLKSYFENEKEKMAEMTKDEKIDYILTYYKAYIVGAIVLLIILIWLPFHLLFSNAKQEFQCAMVNSVLDNNDEENSKDLSKFFGMNKRKSYAYLDTQFLIAYPHYENLSAETSFYEKFFLNIRVGSMDAAVVPESYMKYCNSLEHMFYDIPNVLREDQIVTYQKAFVSDRDSEGLEYICGIDITDCPFLKGQNFSFIDKNLGERAILVFPMNGKHKTRCQDFIDYLYQ